MSDPTAHDELAMPEFEDRLWGELAGLHARRAGTAPVPSPDPVPRPPGPLGPPGSRAARGSRGPRAPRGPRGRRLAVLAAGLGTVAAGVAAVVAVSATSGTRGSDSQRVEASVVDQVLAATEGTDAAIVRQTNPSSGGHDYTERWYDEVTSAARYRTLRADGTPLTDAGWPEPPGVDEQPDPGLVRPQGGVGVCDPASGLTMDAEGNLQPCERGPVREQPTHAVRIVDHCREVYGEVVGPVVVHPAWDYIRMYLETGHLVEDGTDERDGRTLLRLRNADSSFVVLVDPETFLPASTAMGVGEDRTVTTYERLPRTEENLALLSPPIPDGFTASETTAGAAMTCVDNPEPGSFGDPGTSGRGDTGDTGGGPAPGDATPDELRDQESDLADDTGPRG